MGKNQAYKAMQRAKMASHTAAGGPDEVDDGMMDGSFHSPEWHAARLASLQTSHTVTWEEWKKKQKEEAKRQGELEDDEARMMREYRAQLDAERARKLARGKNHLDKREKPRKVEKKERDKDREKEKSRSGKKRKRSSKRRKGRSDSDSDSESSSSDEDERDYRKERRKSKKDKKDKKHKSRRKRSRSSSDESSSDRDKSGPLPLSCYLENGK